MWVIQNYCPIRVNANAQSPLTSVNVINFDAMLGRAIKRQQQHLCKRVEAAVCAMRERVKSMQMGKRDGVRVFSRESSFYIGAAALLTS